MRLYPTIEAAKFIKRIGDDAIWDVTLPVGEVYTVRIPASCGVKTAVSVAKIQQAGR